jgi:hypothetical protein
MVSKARVRFPSAKEFFLLHSIHTDTGAQRQGREADHSPPSTTEVKKGGAIPPLPYAFMA